MDLARAKLLRGNGMSYADSSCIGYSDILNKLETIVYYLCFKKQTLELLLHLSVKAEFPAGSP